MQLAFAAAGASSKRKTAAENAIPGGGQL